MKKRYVFLVLFACFLLSLKVCPRGIDNSISLLLENNFFIPEESNICSFRDTIDSLGSGEGWLYGEDDKYYYGVRVDDVTCEIESVPAYYVLKKGQESQNFDKFNYHTWDKKVGAGWHKPYGCEKEQDEKSLKTTHLMTK